MMSMWMQSSRATARRWLCQTFRTDGRSRPAVAGTFLCLDDSTPTYTKPTTAGQVRCFSTMELIKNLRTASGAPIVDCKKALASCDNDLTAALDWLREHGAAKVTSIVGDREAKEGLVGLRVGDDHQSAALVQVSSETDFAGRSDTFVNLVMYCTDAALANPNAREVSDLLEAEHDSKKVQDAINDAIVSIRENVAISSVKSMTVDNSSGGVLVGYVHGRVLPSNAGTAAAIVELAPMDDSSVMDKDTMLETGKKLAMHVVAAKPQYLNPVCVPEDVVESEKQILKKQIEESKKPPDIVEKIVAGRMNKFFETVCLSHQPHMIEEGNPKISKALKEQNMVLKRFELVSIG